MFRENLGDAGTGLTAAPLGFVSLRASSDGTLLECRTSSDMRAGRVQSDVVGRNIADLVPEDISAPLMVSLRSCLATQSVVTHAYGVELVDGTCFREVCFAPSGTGEVVGIISDVTRDYLADARRVHLAEILEASTDYVATTDVNGRILYANSAFRERFGIDTVAEIIEESYSLFGFMSPQSRERFLVEGVPELWRTGQWSGEIEAVGADGSLVPLWQAAIVHHDAAGNPEYFSGISRDISVMKVAQAELSRSEGRFRALLAEGSDVIMVLTAQGRITYASPAIERVLGYAVDDLVGTSAFELIHPDDFGRVMEAFGAAFTGENPAQGSQYRVRHTAGRWMWIESHTTNHLHTPGVEGFIVNARDITARHVANEQIELAAALLTSVMSAAANEAIFVTDQSATIVAFSRGAEVLLGYRAGEVVGCLHPRVFHDPVEVAEVAFDLGVTIEELFMLPPPDEKSIVREWVFIRKDGTTFDGALTVSARFDSEGALAGFLYLASDVTERRRRAAELTQQAHHDSLTGLANRIALNEALVAAVSDPAWADLGRNVLFIDLDRFKIVNDTFGHAVGDQVLVGVSQRLERHLRSADLAVRLGGDEFVVLLGPEVSTAAAHDIADRIVGALAEPFVIDGHTIIIGASVGLASSTDGLSAEDLLLAADGAAYAAKGAGRGRVVDAPR
jgi:diguanylate cyclase (GGDEF)-like protein/PAS domain S-box-containing protein